jgi:hypothetical protein
MVLSLVVFGATLSILDIYNHQTTINNQNNDAQNRARLALDRIVWQLRNISSPITTPKLLERATPYDVVFETVGSQLGANTSGAERVRYCLPNDTTAGSPGKEVLISETQTWNTAAPPASPWSSDPTVSTPCPDSPLPSGVTAAPTIATGVTNRYQGQLNRPAFSFNNSTLDPNNLVPATELSDVTSVQIDLFVNPTPTFTRPSRESELRSAAFLRNQTHAPVSNFTYTPTGSGGVLLNGGISYSPDGYGLSYSWSCTTAGCPQADVLAASTDGLVTWTPGAGTYTVTVTVTDPNGLSTKSDPQQVVVT